MSNDNEEEFVPTTVTAPSVSSNPKKRSGKGSQNRKTDEYRRAVGEKQLSELRRRDFSYTMILPRN